LDVHELVPLVNQSIQGDRYRMSFVHLEFAARENPGEAKHLLTDGKIQYLTETAVSRIGRFYVAPSPFVRCLPNDGRVSALSESYCGRYYTGSQDSFTVIVAGLGKVAQTLRDVESGPGGG